MAQIKLAEYTFNNSVGDCLPTLTPNTITMTSEDSINGTTTTRTVYIDDGVPPTKISFQNNNSLVEVHYLKIDNSMTSMEAMFHSCKRLSYINTSDWDTSNIISMQEMFYSCNNLISLDTSSFNTSKVTNMKSMFRYCQALTSLDLSSFDTSEVTNMSGMFYNCYNLTSLNISNFDTNNVTDFSYMFYKCSKIASLDLSSFDTGSVTNMNGMFDSCTSNQTVYISPKWTLGEDFPPTFKSPSIVAKYRFTSTTDTLPNFNSGYVYTVSDEDNGNGTTTRTIYSETAPTSISFYNRTDLLEVYELDISGLTSFSNLFTGCEKLTTIHGHENWDTTKITSFNATFQSCKKLQSLDMTNWDVSNVTSFDSTFYACDVATSFGDLSKWNVSETTSMYFMFRRCGKITTLGDISNWDVSKCTSFRFMFFQAGLTEIDITNWKYIETESNLRVDGMFGGNNNLISIKGLENMPSHLFNNVTQMFYNSSKITTLEGLNKWKISSKITALTSMFANCSSLTTLDLSGWDVSKVTVTTSCFDNCTNLVSLNINGWDLSSATTTTSMFNKTTSLATIEMSECPVDTINTIIGLLPTRTSAGAISTTVPQDQASNIDTTTATSKMWNITNRFIVATYKMQADSNTLPASIQPNNYRYTDVHNEDNTTTRTIYNTGSPTTISFNSKTGLLEVLFLDMSNISNVSLMFNRCSALTKVNTDGWTLEKVNNVSNMFSYCSVLTELDLSSFNLSNVTTMQSMFNRCSALTTIGDTSNWNVGKVTSMNYMFEGCRSLEALDVSKWDVSSLKTMTQTFDGCSKLTELDVSNWNTGSITGLASAFSGCSGLNTLDVSKWDTRSLTTMTQTFKNCSSLTFLDASNWNVEKVTTMNSMFYNCTSLVSLDLSNWNTIAIKDIASMFNSCYVLEEIKGIENFNTDNVTSMNQTFCICRALKALDLSKWNDTKVTAMDRMFQQCLSLETLDVSGFTGALSSDYSYWFEQCKKLKNVDLSNFNFSSTDTFTGMFSGGATIQNVGMVYSSAESINTLASLLPNSTTVFYYDADETQLVKPDNVNYVKYTFPTNIQLPPHIELRSVGEVRDEIDLETGILIKRIEVDENGYPFILEEPIEEKVILNYTNSCDYGRILPTGTYDKYNVVTSEYYQTMTTILLDGKNVWSEMEEMTNTIKFTATGETVEIEELNMLGAGGLYCDNDLFPNINDDSDVEHCRVDEEGNKFYIYISKERLMSPDLIGYQIWLQQNKFNMTYELAVPQNIIKPYEELDSTQARWDTLDSKRDCVIYLMSTDKDDDFIITPTFEYITPSPNNFYLDLLLPNTEYTIYAEGINEEIDTINLGGVTTPYTRACLMTSGDNKWVTFDNNETFDKVMIIKGNSQEETVTYFKGIGNIDNPTITIVNEDETQQSQVSYPDVHLRSVPTGERDYFDAILGTVTQWVGVRPFEDGDLENMDLITDGINTLYPLTEPITQYVTPKPLLAYDNGKIKITSDTGLVTTLTYAVPFSNTYRLPHLKTGTLYTIKYPSASGTITIGDITYRITSDSMLFTTPLVINGDTSAIIFSDENPQNVILLEGGYSNREVAYFAGIKSVSNPIITIIDNTVENPENVEYKPTNEIELRSLPNGIADLLDIVKQKVTISVGYRHYQEGDEYLDNVWTDGYNTAYALENPIVRDVQFVTPVISTNSTMKLSSNGLIPQLNYRVPSTNNFPLDLLLPNTTYTLYGQADTPITYSLGGVHNSTLMGAEAISLGNTTNNLLTFNGDISSANVMLVKGDTTGISVPYFQGVKSINNIDFIIEGLQGERNTMSLQNNVSLRACGNIKDSIDMTTCILTKELGEVVLRGNEAWFSLEEIESINVDYVLFGCIVGGAANSQSTSVICNRFNHKYLSGSLHQQECVYCTDNQVRICIKKTTIGGNNITALKAWLGQNNVSVIYALRTPLSEKLTSVWETMPPTSYNNQTTITTQPHSNTPKPMITITVATTTIEQIISELKLQNTQLENENIATMLALTDVYEAMVAPMAVMSLNSDPYAMSTMSLDDEEPATNVVGYTVSPMGMVYAKLVHRGLKAMYEVPYNLQVEVMYALKGME